MFVLILIHKRCLGSSFEMALLLGYCGWQLYRMAIIAKDTRDVTNLNNIVFVVIDCSSSLYAWRLGGERDCSCSKVQRVVRK